MTEKKIYTWTKVNSRGRSYHFQFSPKLQGIITRKGLWSPDGFGEMGDRTLRFSSNGKANMSLKVIEGSSQEQVGKFNFYWKDFQKSQLELSNGSIYYFRSFSLLRGVWSWIKKDAASEQYIFTVDSPFHRSGTIESPAKDLPALERDILLLLGLHLQHYINIWLITIIIVIIAVVSGN
ncbi:MAG: hypothetical protein H8E26_02825 [FCB group bacterium]|nr:hypothetical protein [FCB group bacterium]MBL7029348.1 hypothetical protein [Candidatus Neomarinimicrobiota bacterium]MBL7120717.1 hypothetical protein [Candidatus Neomarinimicrobiota bacterium]